MVNASLLQNVDFCLKLVFGVFFRLFLWLSSLLFDRIQVIIIIIVVVIIINDNASFCDRSFLRFLSVVC